MAPTVETHFANQLAEARQRGVTGVEPAPTAKVVEAMIDAAFWASLRREEGQPPKISLAFVPPEQAGMPLLFEKRLPLLPAILLKLAPGVERPGIHLGVWQDGEELYVWGTTRDIRALCLVLDVSDPGLLVVKHRRLDGYGKFVNVAVLIGDQVKVVDENSLTLPDSTALLASFLDFTSSSWNNSLNVLVQLAVSMRAHKRGGSMLIVPAGSDSWRESIVHPISYPVVPPYSGLSGLMRQEVTVRSQGSWQQELHREVESIAGLTALDGATIINDEYEVLAFGAKIGRRKGNAPVDKLLVSEPVVGVKATVIPPAHNGGTRHLSAAQFVHDQRDALALVASQDGRFTIFSWSAQEEIVRAHRIGTLLL